MTEEIEFLKKRLRSLEEANERMESEQERLRRSLVQVWNIFSWVEVVEDQARFDASVSRQIHELSQPHQDSIASQLIDLFSQLTPASQLRVLEEVRSQCDPH
jgi:regulator of replication initiation timing